MKIFNVHSAELVEDEPGEEPELYRHGRSARIGPAIGAAKLGASLYELPPGSAVCPYHYESEEEWILVLAGEVVLRHPGGEHTLIAGDVVAFPSGPDGAHQTTNRGTEPTRFIIFSKREPVSFSVYPDSNKIALQSNSSDPRDRVMVRRGENLDYFDGEPG